MTHFLIFSYNIGLLSVHEDNQTSKIGPSQSQVIPSCELNLKRNENEKVWPNPKAMFGKRDGEEEGWKELERWRTWMIEMII